VASIKSIQDEITMLKCGAIQIGYQVDPVNKTEVQIWIPASPNPSVIKKTRVENDEGNSEEEAKMDVPKGPIVPIS